MLLNNTPIDWFNKKQNGMETATYGSEFMVSRIGIDEIVEMKYMLMTFGEASTMMEAKSPEWIREMIAFMHRLDEGLRESGELLGEGHAGRIIGRAPATGAPARSDVGPRPLARAPGARGD